MSQQPEIANPPSPTPASIPAPAEAAPVRRGPVPPPEPPPLPEGMTYMGSWARFFASFIDTILVTALIIPLIMLVNQSDFAGSFIKPVTDQFDYLREMPAKFKELADPANTNVELPPPPKGPSALELVIKLLLPAIALIMFWRYRSSTPGKMMYKARIVDASTYGQPTNKQLLLRYLGYYAGIATFFIGFVVILTNKRRQGIHDLMANTVVIVPVKKPR